MRSDEAIAALVVGLVLPSFGWRAVFLVGVLPAFLVFWIQSSVPEPPLWTERRTADAPRQPLRSLLSGKVLRTGLLATTMNTSPYSVTGACSLDSCVFVATRRRKAAAASACENDDIFPGVMCGEISGIYLIRLPGRPHRPPKALFRLSYKPPPRWYLHLWNDGQPNVASAAWTAGRLFWYGAFFRVRDPSPAKFPRRNSRRSDGIQLQRWPGNLRGAPFVVGALAVKHGIGPAFLVQAGAFFVAALLSLLLPGDARAAAHLA